MRRLLFVDDDQQLLDGLRRLLRAHRQEWEMRFVSSAAAALRELAICPADVVITDYRMPGMDGGELLRQVKVLYPGTGRLVLSGHAEEEAALRLVGLAHQFLSKPCDPAELCDAIDGALRAVADLTAEGTRAAVSSIELLPSPPAVVRKLIAMIDTPEVNAKLVAALLQTDVALSAKLLQVVNSSFFAPRARVNSLEAAVARLGLRTVRSLVCTEQMLRVFEVPPALAHTWLPALNQHAEATAGLARRLAAPGIADDSFCAGMLHECGQLVLAAGSPQTFITFLADGETSQTPLRERELVTFGMTHEQAGVALLNLWGLPAEIVGSTLAHAAPVEEFRRDNVACVVRTAHHIVEGDMPGGCGPLDPDTLSVLLQQDKIQQAVASWRAAMDEAC